ncbi:MAG: bacteriohopanetetrol glucosamine biosynthesis glycosyltransferase HpnI [Acidobacteria bacterium]|nr:bacteriohopanetetrol glucosamine biosynthesis glycosyltransferase HpnI [Acidobacteriota bacterium]
MSLPTALFWLLMAAVTAATAYSLIALCGVFRFLQVRRKSAPAASGDFTPPVSVLKPLYGADRELEKNLESFCRQHYPQYEILFAVREENDAAVPIVRRLQKEFPSLPMRLIFTGQPRYLNAKVHALEALAEAAEEEVLVISDSDVRVTPDYLRSVVAPLADPRVGLVTCISRGVPGRSIWSVLEALSMNLQFLPGVLSAWVLEGFQFALGPTMVLRKQQVQEIGGFGSLGEYLADDYVLGNLIAGSGYPVALANHIPDHLVCNESFGDSIQHRLRWERSSRRSRPAGYMGQIFLHSLPLALLAWLFAPPGNSLVLPLVAACLGARVVLAWASAEWLLGDATFRRYWWLLPIQDFLSFGIWCWAFFGREVVWRGARFRVLKGGKLEPVSNGAEKHFPPKPNHPEKQFNEKS